MDFLKLRLTLLLVVIGKTVLLHKTCSGVRMDKSFDSFESQLNFPAGRLRTF